MGKQQGGRGGSCLRPLTGGHRLSSAVCLHMWVHVCLQITPDEASPSSSEGSSCQPGTWVINDETLNPGGTCHHSPTPSLTDLNQASFIAHARLPAS